jgi:hypothetical protein
MRLTTGAERTRVTHHHQASAPLATGSPKHCLHFVPGDPVREHRAQEQFYKRYLSRNLSWLMI